MNFTIFSKVWFFLSNAKWFVKVLNNWGFITTSFSNIQSIVVKVFDKNDTIKCDDVKKFMVIFREALNRGLIDIPNVDENLIASKLDLVEQNLVCKIEGVKNAQRIPIQK